MFRGCSGDSWDSLASVVEFGNYYGICFFLNVFLDFMVLTRMFMVIVFGGCDITTIPQICMARLATTL